MGEALHLRALAVSFALSLLASWLVYNLVPLASKNKLPVRSVSEHHVRDALFACAGYRPTPWRDNRCESMRTAETRWRQATYAVWILGAAAILLAVFGAVTLPRSGS